MSGQMKTTGILITLTLLLFVGAAHAAELIFEERFETAGWDVRAFRPGYVAGTAALTTNHAHGGTYSMRGNLKHGVSDGIDGSITGHSNSLWEIDFNNLAATSEAGIIYASMYFRFDDANWAGVDEEGDPATVLDGKFHYITEVSDGLGGMYNHVNQYGSPSYHSVSGNDGSKLSQAWALANWGNYGVYGSYAPTVILPDGQWHRAQYVFDYTNDTFSIWFDGVKFTSSQVTDGKIPIPSDWKWRGLQLFYYKSIGTQDSTDGPTGEYACGWQIDDIELWEGIPDGAFSAPTDDPVGAPAAPTWGTATGGVGVATLDWNDNGEADLSGYTLKRSTTSGGPYTDVNVSLLGNSNYTDSGLAADTYYYVVSATDTSNQESSNSSEVSAVVTASGGTGTTAPSSISVTDGH